MPEIRGYDPDQGTKDAGAPTEKKSKALELIGQKCQNIKRILFAIGKSYRGDASAPQQSGPSIDIAPLPDSPIGGTEITSEEMDREDDVEPAVFPEHITRRLEPNDQNQVQHDETVRDPLHQADTDPEYAANYEQTTRFILETIDAAALDPDHWYHDFFPSLHLKMTENGYRGVSWMATNTGTVGEYRSFDDITTHHSPVGILENLFFADITGDVNQGSWPVLKYDELNRDLFAQGKRGYGTFFYPEHEFIQPALEQMREYILNALQATNEDETLDQLAKANWFVRYHPFPTVNNSIFMAITNSILEKKGMNKLPHLFLDLNSHWLEPNTYSRVFKWSYKNFAESPTDITQANESRARLEQYLAWRKATSERFTNVNSMPSLEDGKIADASNWLVSTNNYDVPQIQSYPDAYKSFALWAKAYYLQSGLGLP
ncbi:hypothetical protein KA012_00380 [Candidatus Woesebacteria bacterium]|nr:hypothetical protein [Candidatus Woesebacteria bacterium]